MAEMLIRDGDYVRDCAGSVVTLEGANAVLQRALFLLSAKRGKFPLMENIGSRLYLLPTLAPDSRAGAAEQYAAEALEDEDGLVVTGVATADGEDGRMDVTVAMEYGGDELSVTVSVQ